MSSSERGGRRTGAVGSGEGRSSAHQLPLERADGRRRPDGRRTRPGSRRGRASAAAPRRRTRAPAPRLRATPWYSGVSQATTWRNVGSDSTGKNVPENRNSGVIPKRNTALNVSTLRCVAENAAIGPANASPVRTPAGIASTIKRRGRGTEQRRHQHEDRRDEQHPERDPGEVAEGDVARTDRRRDTSRGRRGSRRRPPMIGNVDSNAAVCIARRGQQARGEEREVAAPRRARRCHSRTCRGRRPSRPGTAPAPTNELKIEER